MSAGANAVVRVADGYGHDGPPATLTGRPGSADGYRRQRSWRKEPYVTADAMQLSAPNLALSRSSAARALTNPASRPMADGASDAKPLPWRWYWYRSPAIAVPYRTAWPRPTNPVSASPARSNGSLSPRPPDSPDQMYLAKAEWRVSQEQRDGQLPRLHVPAQPMQRARYAAIGVGLERR